MLSAAAAPDVRWCGDTGGIRALWTTIADVFAILTALSLPWSTSLVAIFVACWLGAVAWMIDWRAYCPLLKRPICYLPIGAVRSGALSARSGRTRHGARGFYAISPTAQAPVLPGLFYHFERSSRGMWVFIAFLVSCTLLMLMSWLVAIDPSLSLKAPGEPGDGRGIFVKNYIDQSQEFALCAVALAYPVVTSAAGEPNLAGAGCWARSRLSFVVNMVLRDRVADGARYDADHARGVCAASSEAAHQPDHYWPADRPRRRGFG